MLKSCKNHHLRVDEIGVWISKCLVDDWNYLFTSCDKNKMN